MEERRFCGAENNDFPLLMTVNKVVLLAVFDDTSVGLRLRGRRRLRFGPFPSSSCNTN